MWDRRDGPWCRDALAAHCSAVFSRGAAMGGGGGGLAAAVTVAANIDMHSAQPIEREADPLLVGGQRVCLCVCAYVIQAVISGTFEGRHIRDSGPALH